LAYGILGAKAADKEVAMFVRDRMSPNPITIKTDTSVSDALRLMRERKVRRLPVVDSHGQLVGIVSDSDLLYASPSPATSLSVWEIHDLLYRLTVDKVMTRDVVTVNEDTPLEAAARLMSDKKIGGLPVMRGKNLVGIITETDLFKAFLAALGGRRAGVRVTVLIPDVKGTVAKIAGAISEAGGNIVGLALSDPTPATGQDWEITFKVKDVPMDKLVEAIKPTVHTIVDARET
jgi:acetoin utilization protein AcuB